jgi:hypothetical protein
MADSIWIDIRTRGHDIVLQENHRPYSLFLDNSLTSTDDPQILMLIGAKQKTQFMKRLFLIQGRESHRKVHLFRIPGMSDSSSPVFLADCELHNTFSFRKAIIRPIPGVIDQRSIRWLHKIPSGFRPATLTTLVYTKLISPFPTTIVFFVDDLGGTKSTAQFLASWITGLDSQSSDMPQSTYPRALILMSWNECSTAFDEKLATISFMQELRLETDQWRQGRQRIDRRLTEDEFVTLLQEQFSDLRVLSVPPDDDELAEHRSWPQVKVLRTRILQESQDIQHKRRGENVAFSSRHFTTFLHSACDSFATDLLTPFSFLKASREPNPVPQNLAIHLCTFLRTASRKTLASYIPIIASALTLDSYPPGMHCKST